MILLVGTIIMKNDLGSGVFSLLHSQLTRRNENACRGTHGVDGVSGGRGSGGTRGCRPRRYQEVVGRWGQSTRLFVLGAS